MSASGVDQAVTGLRAEARAAVGPVCAVGCGSDVCVRDVGVWSSSAGEPSAGAYEHAVRARVRCVGTRAGRQR